MKCSYRNTVLLFAGISKNALRGILGAAFACILLYGVGTVARAAEPWQPLQIIDVGNHPWDTSPRFRSKTKTFFKGPNDSSLIYASFAPRWDMNPPADPLGSHYHHWHEWAYILDGDFVIHEPVSPHQKSGMLSHFTQGTWLDRPAYSLHGGGWEVGGKRAQNACTLLIFEEGDGSVVTVGPHGDHFKPDFPDRPQPYRPDWQAVEQFTRPWIVHTTTDLEWETDSAAPGRMLKWLSDDQQEGFRARLVKIPPGWTAPPQRKAGYYQRANRLIYVLYGEVSIMPRHGSAAAGTQVQLSRDFFVHQPPYSVFGFADGPVTSAGAVWLEVTYAQGLAHGGGRIETPTYLE
ncbi:MAG: hypothetical protein OXD47_12225 [Gammaproteobacteria bacterium]|nr:hypothetical protein [Gammaproteobacteria bacterium]